MTVVGGSRLVSVVIPAYNAGRFVGRTVESARAQTHRNLEILVVDDGSTDGTASVVESIARSDARVRLLSQENRGVAEARNAGLREARGEFVALLDADDLWHPAKIERQLTRFEGSTDILGVVYCWCCPIDADDRILDDRLTDGTRPAAEWMTRTPEGRVLTSLIYRCFLGNGSTPLIRRDCFDRVGIFDPSFSTSFEDWDMYLRLAERFEFGVVPEFLVGYRQVENSRSSNLSGLDRRHALLLDGAYQRNPDLPRAPRRWSRASLFALMAAGQQQQGRRARAAAAALHAVLLDPVLLLSPEARRAAGRLVGGSDTTTANDAEAVFGESQYVRASDAVGKPARNRLYEHLIERRWNRLATISNRAHGQCARST